MKTFALPVPCRLKLTKTTPHKEHHGPDLRQAVSLRLRWETTNDNLATLHPNLKAMLYWREPEDEAQEKLPNLEEVTPNLRVPTAALPLKLDNSWTGYTFKIEHGIDDSTALDLYVCDLAKFAVDAKEGGTVSIDWSLHSNKEITPELVGALCGLEGCEIVATLTPPAVATGEVIDGTQQAFDADHPDQGTLALGDDDAPAQDATGAFVERHAGDFGADDSDDDSTVEDDADGGPTPADMHRRPLPKYRDPETGQTWSGRGLKPKWMQNALAAGKTLAEFEL